ncbi:hypothetical protein BRM3_09035 [Brachybacterium huguangmaarense]|uniref:Uncharacterized protein n=1 Tax=Brachybacterium huguangmaarense TaxID=1652028 RepID=A0ABY6FYJ8_9MICO|nr:hypothetical protein [Brachybacterium huguangmaarense]UYG15789.1 hypothetical protein BRM3_09035 [Brachybacterium huguangmaarense]
MIARVRAVRRRLAAGATPDRLVIVAVVAAIPTMVTLMVVSVVRGNTAAATGYGLAALYAGLALLCEIEVSRLRAAAAPVDPGETSLVMVGGPLDGAEIPLSCPCGCGGGLPGVPDRIVVGGSVYERDGVAHTAYRMTAVPGGDDR